jgi:hypothetical protein
MIYFSKRTDHWVFKSTYNNFVHIVVHWHEHEIDVVERQFNVDQVHTGLDNALGRRSAVLQQVNLKMKFKLN